MRSIRQSLPVLVLCSLWLAQESPAASSVPAEPPRLEGRWEGAILFEEGRVELDVVLRLVHEPGAGWTAALDLPPLGVEGQRVETVDVGGDALTLRFDLGDGGGERVLAGRLEAGGETISGTFTQTGRSSPIHLERRPETAAGGPAVEVVELPGAAGLRERFNRDRGTVRLLLLLSPS